MLRGTALAEEGRTLLTSFTLEVGPMQWGDLKWQRCGEAFAIVQLKGNRHLDIRPNGNLFSMWIESGGVPKHRAKGAIEKYYNVEPIEACCLFYELLAKYGLPE
jgi:hypothetical protein